MEADMNRIEGLLNIIKERQSVKDKIFVVETGTIRNVNYGDSDGHSTRFIAELMRKGDIFLSIDLKTSVCRKYMQSLNLLGKVHLVENDSRVILRQIGTEIDVAYLDSENDSKLIWEEFSIVSEKMDEGGYIVIDDCYPESKEVVKCHKVKQYMDLNKLQYEIKHNQMFIKSCKTLS